jgi:glycosyltransferase involved in cell wall biosynthesis
VPSKFYGIAAAGRPTIFIGSPHGEIARTLAHYRCGYTVSPGDGEALVDRILELASNPALCLEMGARAREAFEIYWDKKGALERFPNGLNREGFPNRQRSDSSCMLVKEASMHGQSPFG